MLEVIATRIMVTFIVVAIINAAALALGAVLIRRLARKIGKPAKYIGYALIGTMVLMSLSAAIGFVASDAAMAMTAIDIAVALAPVALTLTVMLVAVAVIHAMRGKRIRAQQEQ